MEKDILSQVIEAEKEIQKCLELEKVKAREWIEGIKRESQEAFQSEEQKIKHTLEQSLADAAREAEREAAAITNKAAAAARNLGDVNRDLLQEIVQGHIIKILPG
jgi:vacuolar-type H+-ATPase subunit H